MRLNSWSTRSRKARLLATQCAIIDESQQDLPALAGPAAFAQDGTLSRPLFDTSETWTFHTGELSKSER